MAGKTRLPKLALSAEQSSNLRKVSQSRTAAVREVQRARILSRYHAGENIAAIARALQVTRPTVRKWINKALAMGAEAALHDAYHRPHPPVITEEARAWVVHLACCKPKELGYAAELWTRSLLAQHVRREAVAAGHPSLQRAAKATVQRILAAQPLHPERVRYYLEKRDPDFETRMKEVLMVYQELTLQNEATAGVAGKPPIITVSVDEKLGLHFGACQE
jgi:transposase